MPVDRARSGSTFVITLNRPQAMNSIDTEMFFQLGDAWDEFEHDDALLVAVVTGAGDRAFCAGRDLVKSVEEGAGDWSRRREEARLTPDGIWKPVVAAVNGHCLAAGLALALGCDLRVAARNATFGTMAARRGIVAGGGQTQRLARYIAFGKAMEMVLTADRIDAEEAHRLGLANRLVDEGQALDASLAWAARIAANGPLAVRAMKQLMYEPGLDQPFSEALRAEARRYAEILRSEDAAEGARAFAEKREPQFKGR